MEVPAQDTDGDGLSDVEESAIGTSSLKADTDDDGLLDGWEVRGLSGPGFDEPLPEYGADPRRKDIFVEIDWMASASEQSNLNAIIAYQAAVDVVRVFRRSGTGIQIHFDLGPRIESVIPPRLLEEDVDLDEFQSHPDEHKRLPYQDRFPARPSSTLGSTDLSLYDAYFGGYYFRPSRRNIFYYVVFAEQSEPFDDEDPSDVQRNHPYSEGFSDDLSRRDGLRATGVQVGVIFRKPAPDLSPEILRYHYSVKLLHELGHAFGLGHGGARAGFQWDNANYKPNYPSIMNYLYQFCGVGHDGLVPIMDFSHGLLKSSLLERALSEQSGMGMLPDDHVLKCSGLRHLPLAVFPANIDWNEDGELAQSPVVKDVNLNGRIDTDAMADHDDWGRLARDGFDGIGSQAYGGCGLSCRVIGEISCIPGDFNGDSLTDLFILRNDEIGWIISSRDGTLGLDVSTTRQGNLGVWKIGAVSEAMAGDFFDAGRDMIFVHRDREVAVLDYNAGAPRLAWYEDETIGALDADHGPQWALAQQDRFLRLALVPGAVRIAVTNGLEVALLGAPTKDEQGLALIWSGGEELLELTRGKPMALRDGRMLLEGEDSLWVLGGGTLLELQGPWTGPQVRRIDAEGCFKPPSGLPAALEDAWQVSSDVMMVPLDLDGDGSQEVLIKDGARLGVLGSHGGELSLLWSATGTIGDIWPMSADDQILHGQFLPGGGEEVVISNGQSWVTLRWDAGAAALAILAINNGFLADGGAGWKLRKLQALLPGRFLPGDGELLLVQDETRMVLARLEAGRSGFKPILKVDDKVGDWILSSQDRMLVANVDEDPQQEVIVRKGSLFGVIDFVESTARSTFLGSLDPAALGFVEEPRFIRGDANLDGEVDISDVVTILGNLFLGFKRLSCDDSFDVDDSGVINVTDPIYLLAFLFNKGTEPPAPGPRTSGIDPTQDRLVKCPAAR